MSHYLLGKLVVFLFIVLKGGETYFKNLDVFTLQDFKSIFGHFSTLWMRGLIHKLHKPSITLHSQKFNHYIGRHIGMAGIPDIGSFFMT